MYAFRLMYCRKFLQLPKQQSADVAAHRFPPNENIYFIKKNGKNDALNQTKSNDLMFVDRYGFWTYS